MRTLKTILIMSMLLILTTSCTDLTEDLVPNTTENTELVNSTDNTIDGGNSTDSQDTGGDGSENDGGKGN